MKEGKSFYISKHQVLEAYKCVKANHGAGGVDGIDFEIYEKDLKNNLYRLWNRMSSGSYFPKPVRGVEIPKKNGKKRLLGIPTIEDRVAQMVIRMAFEPRVEPYFYGNSYGYRPNKSAIEAISVTRERCWRYPWLIEYDIVGLFDNIDHEKLMKAVCRHTEDKWVIIYIERCLKASIVMPEGEIRERKAGTPQGGVISPVLANLFMHYAYDRWISKNYPQNPWARYADDGVIHCKNKDEALEILEMLKNRMRDCGLEIHPQKTKIVYCRSDQFNERHENESFDFLGYTFRRRLAKGKHGNFFQTFSPAVSKSSAKSFRDKIRVIRHGCKTLSLEEYAQKINPIIRGWMNYFMKFGSREARKQIDYVNMTMVQWLIRKYKGIRHSKGKAWRMLARLSKAQPELFYHWTVGIRPTIG